MAASNAASNRIRRSTRALCRRELRRRKCRCRAHRLPPHRQNALAGKGGRTSRPPHAGRSEAHAAAGARRQHPVCVAYCCFAPLAFDRRPHPAVGTSWARRARARECRQPVCALQAIERFKRRHLLPARGTPRRPDVDHHHLTGGFNQGEARAIERGCGERGVRGGAPAPQHLAQQAQA